MFGGSRSAPSAQSVPVTYPLDIEDIFVYIAACEPSLAGLRFFRENVSNIWLKFLEKLGQLWGASSDDPRKYQNFNPCRSRQNHFWSVWHKKINFYCLGGPRSARPRQRPPKVAKFLWEWPPHPCKFCGPIFCQDMGPVGLSHAEKFQCSLTPKGEIREVKNFSSPLPPSKSLRQTPSKLCRYVRLCVPYKPWKFGDGLKANFWGPPIWKYGTPV